MISDDRAGENLDRDFRGLGICWAIYGVLRLAAAVWLVSFSNTATVMFGALLARVPDPFAMMSFFHLFYTLLVTLTVVCGLVSLLAGLALISGRESGRVLALIAGFLSLSDIPLGITLGIYTLIVLLRLRIGSKATFAARRHQANQLSSNPSTT